MLMQFTEYTAAGDATKGFDSAAVNSFQLLECREPLREVALGKTPEPQPLF